MALVENKLIIQTKEVEKKQGDKIVTVPARVFIRMYPCREQVIARKSWKKFGDVQKMSRGEHKIGDFTVDAPVKIQTHEGDIKQQIQFVKQFKNLNTQTIKANQALRSLAKND